MRLAATRLSDRDGLRRLGTLRADLSRDGEALRDVFRTRRPSGRRVCAAFGDGVCRGRHTSGAEGLVLGRVDGRVARLA